MTTARQANRKTAIVAFVIALILAAAIVVLNPQEKGGDLPTPPSTFFSTTNGARAIYRVFQRLMPKTKQWMLPLTELEFHRETTGATLVSMAPPDPLSEAEALALDKWIRSGGQLILATNRTWDIDHPKGDPKAKRQEAGDVLARYEIYRRPGEGANALRAAEIKSVGKGRVIYVPDGFAFSNASLRTTDNAVWLAQRAAEWSETTLFDEYHQGFATRRSFFTVVGLFLFSPPWGFVCLQLILAGVIYIAGCQRRFGKIRAEIPEERTSPIEAADALGGLFRTAQAQTLSIRSIHQHLNLELSRLCGQRIDLLTPEGRDRVARRSKMTRSELDTYAAGVSAALRQSSQREEDLLKVARTASNLIRSLDHGSAAIKRHAPAASVHQPEN